MASGVPSGPPKLTARLLAEQPPGDTQGRDPPVDGSAEELFPDQLNRVSSSTRERVTHVPDQRSKSLQADELQPQSSGVRAAPPHQTSARIGERRIADVYRSNRNAELAYNSIIDLVVSEPRFSHLERAKHTLFDLNGREPPPPAGSVIDQPFIRDAFKIRKSNVSLNGYTVNDTIFDTEFPAAFDGAVNRINVAIGDELPPLKPFSMLAHRDAFQLIPRDRSISRHNSQFAGAKMENVTLQNLRVHSPGSLQGVFSSDGAYENLTIRNITINTKSDHQVAILGLLSGTLDLTDRHGNPAEVTLLPLRLGGGTNIYIASFSEGSSYQYGDVGGGTSNTTILDLRTTRTKRGTYYADFDMDQFIGLMRRRPDSENFFDSIKRCAAVSGRLLTE